jgi:hypothetical protein
MPFFSETKPEETTPAAPWYVKVQKQTYLIHAIKTEAPPPFSSSPYFCPADSQQIFQSISASCGPDLIGEGPLSPGSH